jgi:hypothetical protein
MDNIALITSLFDYPDYYEPSFYKNALKFFKDEDIHILRNSDLISRDRSLYDKLYHYKIVVLKEYLEKNIVGNYKYVLFLDGTDTNFIKEPVDLIDKFKKLNCSVILGAEKTMWPNTEFSHLYENKRTDTEYKFLNSGTYFGESENILKHINSIIERDCCKGIDDQGQWSIEYLLSDEVMIDQECNFFFSTLDSKNKITENDGEYHLINVDAYIVHDNGPYTENTIKLTQYYNK